MQTTQKLQNLIFSGQPENLELAKALAQSTAHPFAAYLEAVESSQASSILQSYYQNKFISCDSRRTELEIPIWWALLEGCIGSVSLRTSGIREMQRLCALGQIRELFMSWESETPMRFRWSELPSFKNWGIYAAGGLEVLGGSPPKTIRELEVSVEKRLEWAGSLAQMSGLERISLRCNHPAAPFLAAMWPQLESLPRLRSCSVVLWPGDALPADMSRFEALNFFSIQTADRQLVSVEWPTRWPPSLDHLALIGVNSMRALPESLRTAAELREISLYQCPNLVDLSALAHIPALKFISIEAIGLPKNAQNFAQLAQQIPHVRIQWR